MRSMVEGAPRSGTQMPAVFILPAISLVSGAPYISRVRPILYRQP
jgi:hypothetical protein